MNTPFPPPEPFRFPLGLTFLLLLLGGWLIFLAWNRRSKTFVGCSTFTLVFVALLFLPRFQGLRELNNRTQCRNNLKTIGIALHQWHDEHGQLPDQASRDEDGPPVSWRVMLLERMTRPGPSHWSAAALSQVANQYSHEHAWDTPENLPVAKTNSWAYTCPTNFNPQDAQQRYYTAYALLVGADTAFPGGRGTNWDAVEDGTSNTLLVGEAAGLNIVWTEPRDIDTEQQPAGVNLDGARPKESPGMLSSYHTGGTQALLADGSVRFVSEKIDPAILKALTTIAGGESVGGW